MCMAMDNYDLYMTSSEGPVKGQNRITGRHSFNSLASGIKMYYTI